MRRGAKSLLVFRIPWGAGAKAGLYGTSNTDLRDRKERKSDSFCLARVVGIMPVPGSTGSIPWQGRAAGMGYGTRPMGEVRTSLSLPKPTGVQGSLGA